MNINHGIHLINFLLWDGYILLVFITFLGVGHDSD